MAQAVDDTGIRALVGEVLYDFPSPNYGPPAAGLKFTDDLCRTYRNHPWIRVAIQPPAVHTCSPDLLQQCGPLAEEYDTRLIMHLSETPREMADCLDRYGATPVGHLYRLGPPAEAGGGPRRSPDRSDRHGASGGHRRWRGPLPGVQHEAGFRHGPGGRSLAPGASVALGTDGCASNNNLDLIREIDTAAKLAKVRRLDPTVLPARHALALATGWGRGSWVSRARWGPLPPG